MNFVTGFKVFALYTVYFIIFAVFFAVMAALLVLCAVGVPFGIMMSFFGFAAAMFKADFVITELAPQVMLFAGLGCAFAAAASGLSAVKLGFIVCRLFRKTKRRCDRLRDWR